MSSKLIDGTPEGFPTDLRRFHYIASAADTSGSDLFVLLAAPWAGGELEQFSMTREAAGEWRKVLCDHPVPLNEYFALEASIEGEPVLVCLSAYETTLVLEDLDHWLSGVLPDDAGDR
jgi:hypothetical protein